MDICTQNDVWHSRDDKISSLETENDGTKEQVQAGKSRRASAEDQTELQQGLGLME